METTLVKKESFSMKNNSIYLKVDSRNRVSLTKLTEEMPGLFKAYMKEGKIILEPVQEIPTGDEWIFAPENRKTLDIIKKSLKQKATIKRGSFSKYLK